MKIGFLLIVPENDIDAYINIKRETNFLSDLYREYCNYRHDVVVIILHRAIKRDFISNYSSKLKVYGISPLKHGNISAAMMFIPEILKIKSVLHKENCDVIHANWCYEYAAAALLENKNKTIVTLHDWPDIICPFVGNFYWKRRQQLGNVILKKAENVTAVSQYIAELYINRFPLKKIDVIPNFIRIEHCPKEKTKSDVFRIVSINNGFFGRKNVINLIKAFDLLKNDGINTHLTLIGNNNEMYGTSYKWVQANSSLNNISFLGSLSREETLRILCDLDVLVHPSLEESFGMTLIEAMSLKTLVIGGKSSGAVPWVLGEGKYGILVDVNKPESIYEGMKKAMKIYDNKVLLDAAYNYVNEKFAIDSISSLYIQKYNEIIKLGSHAEYS